MNSRVLFLIGLSAIVVLLLVPTAMADLAVEKVSRVRGKTGQDIEVTLACASCSAGKGKAAPSFPISLVPSDKAPRPYRCGPRKLCSPRVRAIPRRSPFTYLGRALPTEDDEDATGPYSYYALEFSVPGLPAGSYTYVIYCDICLDGEGGTLITDPQARLPWRLRIRP